MFELLTGAWLFDPEGGEDWQVEDDHLAKMLEITGEQFDAEVQGKAQLGSHYFNNAGEPMVVKRRTHQACAN